MINLLCDKIALGEIRELFFSRNYLTIAKAYGAINKSNLLKGEKHEEKK